MTRQFIPASESFVKWWEDPVYRTACDALEEEFALVHALIEARIKAGLTQEQVA